MSTIYAIALVVGPHPDAPQSGNYTLRGVSVTPPVLHFNEGKIIGVEWIPSPGTYLAPRSGRGRRPNTLLTEEAMNQVPWERVREVSVYRTRDVRAEDDAEHPWE